MILIILKKVIVHEDYIPKIYIDFLFLMIIHYLLQKTDDKTNISMNNTNFVKNDGVIRYDKWSKILSVFLLFNLLLNNRLFIV